MVQFNLKEVQEKTCQAIEQQEWVKNLLKQVETAADDGKTRVELNIKGTPAENLGDDYLMLIDYFIIRGFGVNDDDKEDVLTVVWDPRHLRVISPIDRLVAVNQKMTEVLCNLTKAICEDNEEKKAILKEEMDAIIDSLPEGYNFLGSF